MIERSVMTAAVVAIICGVGAYIFLTAQQWFAGIVAAALTGVAVLSAWRMLQTQRSVEAPVRSYAQERSEDEMAKFWNRMAGIAWFITLPALAIIALIPELRALTVPGMQSTVNDAFTNFGTWWLVAVAAVNIMSWLTGASLSIREQKFDIVMSGIAMGVTGAIALAYFVIEIGEGAPELSLWGRQLILAFAVYAFIDFWVLQIAKKHKRHGWDAGHRAGAQQYMMQSTARSPRVHMEGGIPITTPPEGYPEGHKPVLMDSQTNLPEIVTPAYIDIQPVFRLVMPDGTRVVIQPSPRIYARFHRDGWQIVERHAPVINGSPAQQPQPEEGERTSTTH